MNNHSRTELVALIGQSRTTDIPGRKRPLTLPMIRRISAAWHVPEKIPVQEYTLASAR